MYSSQTARDIYSLRRTLNFSPSANQNSIRKSQKTFDSSTITKQRRMFAEYQSTKQYQDYINYINSLIQVNTFYTLNNVWINMPIKFVPIDSNYSEKYITGTNKNNYFYIQNGKNEFLYYTDTTVSKLSNDEYFLDFTTDVTKAGTFMLIAKENEEYVKKNDFNLFIKHPSSSFDDKVNVFVNEPATSGFMDYNILPIQYFEEGPRKFYTFFSVN